MARNRMLNPEFWLDEQLASLSAMARLLYMGLWGICDDNYATLPNRPLWIKAQIFPYETIDTAGLLDELVTSGKLILFTGEDGQEYFFIKNFFKYQKVDRPSKAKYPKFDESSTITRTEVKLSKVKLSKDTNVATDVAETKDDINSLISLFEKVNPNYERLYANRTERSALERMVSKHSYPKMVWAVESLPDITKMPYAPRITTPLELEKKMGQLIQFMQQERSKGSGKVAVQQ